MVTLQALRSIPTDAARLRPAEAATRRRRPLLLPAAALLWRASHADAQGRAHLSDDLQQHLDAGDATATTVIVTGTPDQIAAIAARHGLRVRRLLTSGAVLRCPPGGSTSSQPTRMCRSFPAITSSTGRWR